MVFGCMFCVRHSFFVYFLSSGTGQKKSGILLLEYVGVIKDKRSDAELVKALKSSDEVEQFNAISAMASRRYSSDNAEALLDYLKSDAGTKE